MVLLDDECHEMFFNVSRKNKAEKFSIMYCKCNDRIETKFSLTIKKIISDNIHTYINCAT